MADSPATFSPNVMRSARRPCERRHRRFQIGRDVARRAAGGGNDEEIAAGRAFIAHQSFDEGDRLAVRRPARLGDLQLRRVDRPHGRRGDVDDVQLRDPVVVVARSRRGLGHELLAVRRPVEVVDVHVRRRDDADFLRRHVDDGHALFVDVLLDRPDRARHRHQRSRGARGILDEEERDRLAVRRPLRLGEIAAHVRDAHRRAADMRHENLPLILAAVADGGQRLRVGRPGDVVIVAVAGKEMDVHARGRRGGDADSLHRPRDVTAIRRNGDGVEGSNAIEIIEQRVIALLLRVCERCGEKKDGESDVGAWPRRIARDRYYGRGVSREPYFACSLRMNASASSAGSGSLKRKPCI